MNTIEAVRPKTDRVARTFRTITADTKGNLPTKIEILKVGMWDTPNHGMFMITPEDCAQMVENFTNGVGLPGQGQIGAPIDFGHDSAEQAAGWMSALTFDGTTLYATVTWTSAGVIALEGGTYKCFSPEFYPGSRGGWEDPEQYGVYVPNVLVGGGLTNIPLFKGLKPIMASQNGGIKADDDRNVIYISETKEKRMPTLEEVLAKDVTTLTDEDRAVVTENKDTLTDEQKTKFGIEVAPVVEAPKAEEEKETKVAEVVTAPVDTETAAITASIKSGESVVIKASTLKSLTDMQAEYAKSKASAIVASHLKRGAIVADQAETWTDRLVKDASLEDLLKTLPSNKALTASEIGSSTNGAETTAVEIVKNRANELIKASKDAGETLTVGDAYSKVMASDTELTDRYNAEIKG